MHTGTQTGTYARIQARKHARTHVRTQAHTEVRDFRRPELLHDQPRDELVWDAVTAHQQRLQLEEAQTLCVTAHSLGFTVSGTL